MRKFKNRACPIIFVVQSSQLDLSGWLDGYTKMMGNKICHLEAIESCSIMFLSVGQLYGATGK